MAWARSKKQSLPTEATDAATMIHAGNLPSSVQIHDVNRGVGEEQDGKPTHVGDRRSDEGPRLKPTRHHPEP